MGHRIARWLFEPLLRLLLPGKGHRRRTGTTEHEKHLPVSPYLHRPAARRTWERPLRGEETPMVRPYLVAHERREEFRRQRPWRRALLLAVHGLDTEPRVIHGVKVAV
ncbi:hypothetical protein [Streptomyces africanus]|uniref:hypothetical protein n=1 Tax=Streptomyces africanus TaxID=231024 RepID=UPI001ABFEDBB|nr:hypothetical protein [Streptomyces africanus]